MNNDQRKTVEGHTLNPGDADAVPAVAAKATKSIAGSVKLSLANKCASDAPWSGGAVAAVRKRSAAEGRSNPKLSMAKVAVERGGFACSRQFRT
jgi:hypothetical protein